MGLGGAPRRVDCVECPTLLGLWAIFVQTLDGPPKHAHMTCVGRNGFVHGLVNQVCLNLSWRFITLRTIAFV